MEDTHNFLFLVVGPLKGLGNNPPPPITYQKNPFLIKRKKLGSRGGDLSGPTTKKTTFLCVSSQRKDT